MRHSRQHRYSRDHDRELPDRSTRLARSMGVRQLVERVRGGEFWHHLSLRDPFDQRGKSLLGRKIAHEPIDETISSAHPAQRHPDCGREPADEAYVFAGSTVWQLRKRSANKSAIPSKKMRRDHGPCLVDADGVENQVEAAV